jgi:glycosyltransferase involved in cell wall biosynthesis
LPRFFLGFRGDGQAAPSLQPSTKHTHIKNKQTKTKKPTKTKKAGPGTIAEALICGLPILLNGNIPCQEEGNIGYVTDNGAGAFETDPGRIAALVARWLSAGFKKQLAAMAAASKALGRPEAVYNIARDLAALCSERLEQQKQKQQERRRRMLLAPLAA